MALIEDRPRAESAKRIVISDTDRAALFASELTDLSLKWGIGIAQPAMLFVMDRDDYDRKYVFADDQIEFA